MNPIKLIELTAEAYTKADSFFHSDASKQVATDYFNYVYTSALQYAMTGDVEILNRITMAARLTHKVRITKQLIAIFGAHKANKQGKYTGKANANKLKKVRDNLDDMRKDMEKAINADNSVKAKPAKVKTEAQVLSAVLSNAKKLHAMGVTSDDIVKQVILTLAELDDSDDTEATPVANVTQIAA